MNIKFTQSAVVPKNGNVTQANVGTIEFCSMGNNRGEGDQVIPMKLGNAIISPLVTVKSATTRNKRGTTSALIKVSMPYTAFGAKKSYVENGDSGTQTIKSTLVQDPSRSGGEVSLHIVVAIPSAMTADLNRADDGTGDAKLLRDAAYQQLKALGLILSCFSCPEILPGPVLAAKTSTEEANMYTASLDNFTLLKKLSPDIAVGFAGSKVEVDVVPNGRPSFDAKITGEDGSDYGAGINASRVTAPVLVHNALGRIVRGQPALACDLVTPEMVVAEASSH